MTLFANYPSLKDRVVFVTGGAGGIGAAIVRHFCEQGSRVAFVDKYSTGGEQLVEAFQTLYGVSPLFIPCNLRDVSALKEAIAQVTEKLGDIAVLVNNAGNDERHQTLEVTETTWRNTLADNLDHYFFAAQAVIPAMIKKHQGSIINISSNCFLLNPDEEYIGYVTAKAAIVGMSRALARQYGPYNIRVNCLLPGWIMTQRQLEKWLTPDAEKELLRSQCLKKKLFPDDIARMVLFMAADDSEMYTKMELILDAGRV